MEPGEPPAVLVDVGQRKARAQPLVVLLQAAVAHLGQAEHTLEDAERPLHLGSDSCLGPVLALLGFIYTCFGFHSPRLHVLRSRRGLPNRLRRPRPSSRRHAADPAACAHRRPKPPSSKPSARCLLWSPPRCAPSSRNTTDCLSWSGASPDRAAGPGSWSTTARG